MSNVQPKLNAHGMETYTNTELIVREDILSKAKELAQLISTSSEVQIFRKIEKQIGSNDRVQQLIKDIKKKAEGSRSFRIVPKSGDGAENRR